MGNPILLDYSQKARAPSSKERRTTRDILLVLAAVGILLGCCAGGRLMNMSVGLKYIDGAEGKPHTPEDAQSFAIAAWLPYVGAFIGAAIIIATATLGTIERRAERKAAASPTDHAP